MATTNTLDREFERIARETLFVDTLKTRGRDHLDFPECSVTGLRDALKQAYELGVRNGRRQGECPER